MAKKKTSNVNKTNNTKKKARPRRQPAMDVLDQGAVAYRRLLLDPCNAPLCGPVYPGAHGGVYHRVRRLFTVNSPEVEGTYVFQPGTNTLLKGGHSAANAGTPYTLTEETLFDPTDTFALGTEARALAGCVKVRYIGSEQNRSGSVGMATGTVAFAPGMTTTAAVGLAFSPVIGRIGETQHETKFVPMFTDAMFRSQKTGAPSLWVDSRSTMVVTYQGAPAGTIQFEVTCVYEVDAKFNNGVLATVPPASGNTLDHVLRSLGPVSNWAFNHVVVPTIRGVATAVQRTVASSIPYAASNMAMLTL